MALGVGPPPGLDALPLFPTSPAVFRRGGRDGYQDECANVGGDRVFRGPDSGGVRSTVTALVGWLDWLARSAQR